MPFLIAIGKILKPRGIKGELKVLPLTKDPARFDLLEEVYIGNNKYLLENVWYHGNFVVIKIKGFNDRTSVENFRNLYIEIPEEQTLDLEEDEYYIYQLIGTEVVTVSGEKLGILKDVLEMPANDVYVIISDTGKEILLPAVEDVIKKVDIKNKQIIVDPVSGMI